jgi:hypothetical protein
MGNQISGVIWKRRYGSGNGKWGGMEVEMGNEISGAIKK